MPTRPKFTLLLAVCFFSAQTSIPPAGAQPPSPQAGTSVAVLELFTSEGCSSCPPADALLRTVQENPTLIGQPVMGISEHVTYWDHLGWKDPYSAEVFTDRQTTYARRLSPDGPYTPQMVLNGRYQFVGSDKNALKRALSEESRQEHMRLRVLSSVAKDDLLVVRFVLEGTTDDKTRHPFDIVAVLADDVDRSNVLRGENSGRSLQHVSVAARAYARWDHEWPWGANCSHSAAGSIPPGGFRTTPDPLRSGASSGIHSGRCYDADLGGYGGGHRTFVVMKT